MPIDAMLEYAPAKLLWGLLYLYNFAESSVAVVLDFFQRLTAAYTALFRPKYYIFFEGSTRPHPFYTTHHWATGSAAPELMYCADQKLFFPWIPRNTEVPGEAMNFDDVFVEDRYRSMPFLSIELVDADGKVAYDLTDFIETMRYVEFEGFPVPDLLHILSAWTLSSCIVPDYKRLFVRFIDVDGNVHDGSEEAPAESASETVAPEAPAPAPETVTPKASVESESKEESVAEVPAAETVAPEAPVESESKEESVPEAGAAQT